MTGEIFDAEVNLTRQVAFIDQLTDTGALTPHEANAVLARIADTSAAVVGALIVRVRLDKTRV